MRLVFVCFFYDFQVRARGRGALLARLAQQQQEEKGSTEVSDPESHSIAQVASSFEAVELESEVEKETLHCRGSKGTTLNVVVNYIKLLTDPDKGVFEYLVDFQPAIASRNIRCKLLSKIRNVIGETRTFDGVTLYLPIKLPDKITTSTVEDNKGEPYEIQITFKKQKRFSVSTFDRFF